MPIAGVEQAQFHARARMALPAAGLFLDTTGPLSAKSRAFKEPLMFPGSSVVERRTVNPLVAGSSPARGANLTQVA
jgi:hypothetical protein